MRRERSRCAELQIEPMSSVATHPNKPRTMFCRRRHLIAWTGWSDWQIDIYVAQGLLRTRKIPGHPRRSFEVQSAQEIIDSGK